MAGRREKKKKNETSTEVAMNCDYCHQAVYKLLVHNGNAATLILYHHMTLTHHSQATGTHTICSPWLCDVVRQGGFQLQKT